MGILTTTYRRSQLRSLPVPGGKAPVDYCYVVRIPGRWQTINHSFRDWSVGDFRQQQQETRHD